MSRDSLHNKLSKAAGVRSSSRRFPSRKSAKARVSKRRLCSTKEKGFPLTNSNMTTRLTSAPVVLLGEIRQLIDAARQRAAAAVNSELTLLYWRIGERIHTQVLAGRRAEYGEEIIATLSQQLMNDYGKGFSYTALTRMTKFYEAFPNEKIVATLSQQLSWSHFREILPLKRPLQREYYAEMCRVERWSVRTLHERIDSMLYEHATAHLHDIVKFD